LAQPKAEARRAGRLALQSSPVRVRSVARAGGVAMPDSRRIFRLFALLALLGVAGCSASSPEPAFETTYSAIGAQVK
jgi:hypothetical protein